MNTLTKSHIKLAPNLWALLVLTISIFSFFSYSAEFRSFADGVISVASLPFTSDVLITFVVLTLMTLPMLMVDLLNFFRTECEDNASWSLIGVKTIGIWSSYAFVGFLYWVLPEYGSWYQQYWDFLGVVMPFLIFTAPVYVWLVTPRQTMPKDGYYDVGLAVLGFAYPKLWSSCRKPYMAEIARQWLIKGFFLPLMLVYFFGNVTSLLDYQLPDGTPTVTYFYEFSYLYLFSIDLSFAAIGYIFTLKLLDTDIRSTDPSMLGWVACLMCYSPFWNGLFSNTYFLYDDNLYWGEWLGDAPIFYMLWAFALVILIALYAMATVSLGYRFSNLTYRGLSTTGVFRITKHPAYVFKNMTWWMISIPFIPSGDWLDALRSCLLLLGVNAIYFMRAKTEERHLSQYPEYIDYANWINHHGIFRWVGDVIPALRYNADKTLNASTPVWWRRAGIDVYPRHAIKFNALDKGELNGAK